MTPARRQPIEAKTEDQADTTRVSYSKGKMITPSPPERLASTDIIERGAWSLVWLGAVIGGLDLWNSWSAWSWGGVAAPLLIVIGIGGLAATWLVSSPRSWFLQVPAMATMVMSTLGNHAVDIHTAQYYSTDSAAFNQVAARLLQHGLNPYTTTMSSAAQLLQYPANYWSYLVDGGHVTEVSYPAGSFLFQLPALVLGFHHQIVDWIDLFAWLLTCVLVFVLLPRSARWIAALLLVIPIFSGIFAAGGTDATFMPFLVLAVWRWDRFGTGPRAGLARWVGPVALGLACSIKQLPWFCVLFLAVGIYVEARSTGRRAGRLVLGYLATVVGVFGVVNLPFIVWAPSAWVDGVLLPFRKPLVADGQGLVTLALHGVSRGVSLPLLTAASALVYVSLLAALKIWYPQMKRIWMFLLPAVFFVATRSLSSYLLDLYPPAIVAAISVAPAIEPALVKAKGRLKMPYGLAVVVPGVAAVVVSVLAFTSPPLDLSVRSFATSPQATSLEAVTVTVHNGTNGTVTPHFMVTIGSGHPNGFWHTAGHRTVVLGPGTSTTVTLFPSQYTFAPPHGSHWLVVAYTASPEALSTSPLQFWRLGKAK